MADQVTCRRLQSLGGPVLSMAIDTCAVDAADVYSEHYSAYAGCASARPPGADTRRPPPPPPLAGVVPFVGIYSHSGQHVRWQWLRNVIFNADILNGLSALSPSSHLSTDAITAMAGCRHQAAG